VVAEQTALAPEVSGPLAQGLRRPIGITAAAAILAMLWLGYFLGPAVTVLRCNAMLLSYPPICDSSLHFWTEYHDSSGYQTAGIVLAFAAPGVVAGVGLLGLRWRGLGLVLAWVGIAIWVPALLSALAGDPGLGDQVGSWQPWPWSRMYGLFVAGNVYVILALWKWRDRFQKTTGSNAVSPDTSTVPASPLPRDSRLGRFRIVVVMVAGAGLVLAGPVLALAGLVVFVDWISGVFYAPTPFYCPPYSEWCMAPSAKAGVLGLLAASVGVVGVGVGVKLLRKTRIGRRSGRSTGKRGTAGSTVSRT
jgi:hypothetical protein